MIASEPSYTALAASEISALVARGFSTIEFKTCVAVITGLPTRLQALMIDFCAIGTSSGLISTPRSPRAIMIPSTSSMISSKLSRASFRSIFAMIFGVCFFRRDLLYFSIVRRRFLMSCALRTNERATYSTSSLSPNFRSWWSFFVNGCAVIVESGALIPLFGKRRPDVLTLQWISRPWTRVTSTWMRPSSMKSLDPFLTSLCRFLYWTGRRGVSFLLVVGVNLVAAVERMISVLFLIGTPSFGSIPSLIFGP